MGNDGLMKDVIHQNVPEIAIIAEDLWVKIFLEEQVTQKLVNFIRGTPKTFDEIYEQYSSTEIGKKKSYTTIYRQFSDLIRLGIIVEVGHRVKRNRTQSKRLYSTRAQFLLFDNPHEKIWKEESSWKIAKAIGFVLNRKMVGKIPITQKLAHFCYENEKTCSQLRESLIKRIFQSSKSIDDLNRDLFLRTHDSIRNLKGKDFFQFYRYLGILLWIVSLESTHLFLSALKSCFTSAKPTKGETKENNSQPDQQALSDDTLFIHSEPKLFKSLDDDLFEYIYDNLNRRAIITMLFNGPMTIKEIHQNHHAAVLGFMEKAHNEDRKTEIKIPKPKSENTIYRYLQGLIERNIIMEAGRKTIPHQSATQKLYGRTAEVFYRVSDESEFFSSKKSENVVNCLGRCLCIEYSKKTFDKEILRDMLAMFTAGQKESTIKCLESTKKEELKNIRSDFNKQEGKIFFYTLGLVEWLIDQNNLEKMKKTIFSSIKD